MRVEEGFQQVLIFSRLKWCLIELLILLLRPGTVQGG